MGIHVRWVLCAAVLFISETLGFLMTDIEDILR
jgi:hypothetical protein